MRDALYLRQRDADFMRICRDVVRNASGNLTTRQVVDEALKQPAPGYYLTYDYALRTMRRMRREETGSHPRRRRHRPGPRSRMDEIMARVDEMTTSLGITESDALQRLLTAGNASSFFLTPAAALRLFHRIRAARKTPKP